ncbi:hypothetical protein ACYCFC_09610 [Stutzerimonas sp. NM35]
MEGLESQAAILAMQEGRWYEAAQLWNSYMEHEPSPAASDYNACARVYERLACWDLHSALVAQGVKEFPTDKELKFRQQHGYAMNCISHGDWDGAWSILESQRLNRMQWEWPCATNYYWHHVQLSRCLMNTKNREEKLKKIEELSFFKSSDVLPQGIVGIMLAVDCLDWGEDLRVAFDARLSPLIACLSSYDLPVRLIVDETLSIEVANVAAFWHENSEELTGLPAGYYEFFSRLFLAFGYLDLYFKLRSHFVGLLSLFRTEPKRVLAFSYQVSLANELGDAEHYAQLEKRVAKLEARKKGVQHYFDLSAFYYADERYSGFVSEQDKDFSDYIKNRSIAVVGPVDVGLDSGAEIDSFDVVVRFNFRKGLEYAPVVFGERTNISYYLHPVLMKGGIDLIEGMSALDYIVVDGISWRECQWLSMIDCRKRERLGLRGYLKNPMLVGYPCAIQRALLDILRFSPARVKVFSSDLFTSMRYCTEYLRHSTLGRNGGNVFPGLSLHDPVSNFVFMQRLVCVGRIEVDKVMEGIVSLTVSEYIESLRSSHTCFLAKID